MMLAGDEFGRTQKGNNNAYCQDNDISWVDWGIADKGKSLIRFVQKLTRLRRQFPILRRNRFLTGAYNETLEVKDVAWINANGSEMTEAEWADAAMRCFGMLMDGRGQATGIRQRGQDATLLMVLNAHYDVVRFVLPAAAGGDGWTRLLDTNISDDDTAVDFATGDHYDVTARSLLLFMLQR
jgi:glycogen operon protein